MPLPPLYAFGIAHLPMLGWLAVAAVPLLIHLWSRRKFREMPWAAMEFVLAALQQQARRLRFEQWLLLLLRTLLVSLVVLAVSEPYRRQNGLPLAAAGGRTHRVLVIDGSFSMAYKPGERSRFEAAKELATQILEKSPQGDAFTLLLMAAPPRVVVGNASFEIHQMRDEIASLPQLHTTADVPATLAVVRQVIENTARENPRLTSHEVYFFTDLQRASWAPHMTAAATAEFQRQSAELAQRATLNVLDVGQPTADNLAVTALGVQSDEGQAVVTTGRGVTLAATLRNFARQPRKGQVAELLVDGRRVGRHVLDVPAGGETSVTFSTRFETPGDHCLEVQALGDALDVDNHRYLVLPVRQALRVLCIDGRASSAAFRGATGYLAAALAPEGDAADRGLVRVEVASESAVLERDLGNYDCVFLANVGQFTASEARVLDAYLKHAGSLVFFLGDQVQAARYNSELGGSESGSKVARPAILPARLGAVIARRQSGLNPLGYRHPLVAAFRGQEKAGLLSTPVDRYFKLQVAPGSAAKVALALRDGDPLMVEHSVHRGRVVLVATSADVSWTPMPLWPSYVPIVQEILAWCVAPQVQERNVQVGQPLGASLPMAVTSLSLERPDGQTRQIMAHDDGDYRAWGYNDTSLSGFYTARIGSPPARAQCFAVNVDTRESDLTALSPEELRSEVWPGIDFAYATTWQDPRAAVANAIGQPRPLHVEMLYAVLGLLFVETILAWRFGYHTQ